MLKGSAIWVVVAAGVACLAIGVGVFTNHSDEMTPLAPVVSEHVVTADVDPGRDAWIEPRIVAAQESAGHEMANATDAEATAEGMTAEMTVLELASLDETFPEGDGETPDASDASDGEPFEMAVQAFAERDYASVVSHLQRAEGEGDTRFDVHYLLGLALRYEGRADESIAAMEAALAMQPNSVRALTNCARALLETRDLAQAEERVRRALELSPRDTGALNVLGRVQLSNGALAQAEATFARVLEIDAEHAWALNNLGFARLQRGAWDEAAEVLGRAVTARSDVAAFHNNLGIAYERLSRLSDAQREFAEALTLEPSYGKAETSLARVTDRIAEGAVDFAASDNAQTIAAASSNVPAVDAASPSGADALATPVAQAADASTTSDDKSSVQP